MTPSEHEAQVRLMRDLVYGKPSSDLNWDNCKEHWLQPQWTRWLEEWVRKDAMKPFRDSKPS